MRTAAPSSQSRFRNFRSLKIFLVWLFIPKCRFPVSVPIAVRSISSSLCFGSFWMSIGFESGDRRRMKVKGPAFLYQGQS